jgi:hypothetical protein
MMLLVALHTLDNIPSNEYFLLINIDI